MRRVPGAVAVNTLKKTALILPENVNCLVVLGPTAVGKTALAVRLAEHFGGEILSCDSRQVYRGLDIGSGKDLCEYTVPYHLIDITDLSKEYSVFDYQKDFYRAFADVISRGKLPVIAGGTGLYIDSVVRSYHMQCVPENTELRKRLAYLSDEKLIVLLRDLKRFAGSDLHNSTDITQRKRLIRAIEIETYNAEFANTKTQTNCVGNTEAEKQSGGTRALNDTQAPNKSSTPEVRPFILGTSFPRDMLRRFIRRRLKERMQNGLIEEVENLHRSAPGMADGVSWERFDRLGLEYRFVSQFLQKGDFSKQAKEELETRLGIAIGQFAKRQETWFRGMEKKGVVIHHLAHDGSEKDCSVEQRFAYALVLLEKAAQEHSGRLQ